jgi:hypothetical protein
MMDDE